MTDSWKFQTKQREWHRRYEEERNKVTDRKQETAGGTIGVTEDLYQSEGRERQSHWCGTSCSSPSGGISKWQGQSSEEFQSEWLKAM